MYVIFLYTHRDTFLILAYIIRERTTKHAKYSETSGSLVMLTIKLSKYIKRKTYVNWKMWNVNKVLVLQNKI